MGRLAGKDRVLLSGSIVLKDSKTPISKAEMYPSCGSMVVSPNHLVVLMGASSTQVSEVKEKNQVWSNWVWQKLVQPPVR